jgi:hypothetical protein
MNTIDKFNQFYENGGYDSYMKMIQKSKTNNIDKQSEMTKYLAEIYMDFVRAEGKVDGNMMRVFIAVTAQYFGEI